MVKITQEDEASEKNKDTNGQIQNKILIFYIKKEHHMKKPTPQESKFPFKRENRFHRHTHWLLRC